MKKDIPEKVVQDVSVAIVLESATPEARIWNVYLINYNDYTLETVLISSRGYGMINEEEVKTSTLRHSLGDIKANEFVMIEAIDPAVFGLTNEYLLSYYVGREIFDKKFIFLPESIVESNLIRTPVLNKPGVMIG